MAGNPFLQRRPSVLNFPGGFHWYTYIYLINIPGLVKNLHKTLFLVCFLLAALHLSAGINVNKAPVVEGMMQKYHCCPRPLDDQFCRDVLSNFIDGMDAMHLYFTAEDIKTLSDLSALKSQINGTGNTFLNTTITLYKQRLEKADSTLTSILQKPFDLTVDENIDFSADTSSWALNNKELHDRWFKYLKYETLHRLSDLKYYDSTATNDYVLKQQRGELVIVRKTEERHIRRVLDDPAGYETYMGSLFCNAITTAYDPHSEYFPQVLKENFIGELSGNNYSFGFELGENDKGDVEIARLMPGSPAWKCGQLNQNDVLLQLQWQDKPVVDLAGASADEVGELLISENHKRLTLTVHKANGMRVTVTLEKARIQSDDDFVKSYVLDGPKKVGYILLPGFYSEWEASGGSSCANDVAKEVVKLKTQNIDALIIDLRNNGGGSLDEALQLAGIFIDEGTLGFSKEKNERPHALKNPNRGTIYDGPIAILVNGGSASASEFLAAALQDYNRAIIIGSPTFGKATFQEVLPADTAINLDKMKPADFDNGKFDYVKITTGRFYRPTGKTHQMTGVQPDIALPDLYDNLLERESTLKNALLPDSIKRAVIFNPLPPLPIRELKTKSTARISASDGFRLVTTANKFYVGLDRARHHTIPLKFDSFMALGDKYNGESARLNRELQQDSVRTFKAENHGGDVKRLALGGYESEQNERFLKFMMHDIYINEAFLILADYISLKR